MAKTMVSIVFFGLLLPSLVRGASSAFTSRLRRNLGDFDELNQLLKDALIYLGDTSVAEGLVLNLSLENLRCTNFQIGNVEIASQKLSSTEVQLTINVVDLDMVCYMNYRYLTLLFSGQGQATVTSNGNDASTVTIVTSADYSKYPPTSAQISSCATDIVISNLDLPDGGMLALAPVESLLRKVVERQAEATVCRELSNLSSNRVVELLQQAQNALNDYPSSLSVNPLTSEVSLSSVASLLLNFQGERETEIGKLFEFALEETVSYLSANVRDYSNPSPECSSAICTDMRANTVLRDMVLDQSGALVLNVDDFDIIDGVLWEGEDKLTKTKILLNSVKLLGLDTLTKFQPFTMTGNYTIQNELSWKYLGFELDATIDIRPSRASNSVILNPGNTHVVETISVKFGVEDLDATASLLLAVKQDTLEALPLGALLQSEHLLLCLLSALYEMDLSALWVSVSNIQEPTLEGFVSPGLDRIFTNAALAAFQMYEAALLESAPAFFQLAVRTAVNQSLQAALKEQQSRSCPAVQVNDSSELVDFRDLLLKPAAALASGASGTQPYGDLVSTFASQVEDRFLALDENGRPKLNAAVIRPATEAQSGVEGRLEFTETAWDYILNSSTALMDYLELRSSTLTVSHLDSVVEPLDLLTAVGAQNLTNSVRMGQPLSLATNLLFHIAGVDSPLAVENLLHLTISFQNSISFDVLASVTKQKVLEFPLRDVSNVHCWLAALPPPALDSQGNLVDGAIYDGLQLSRLEILISDLDFDVECITCTSAGGEALPQILTAMRGTGANEIIQEGLLNIISEMTWKYWESIDIHQRISEARKLCRHSPYFEAGYSSSFEWPGLPPLSRQSMESLVIFSGLATNFAMVLTARSHLLRLAEPTDPLFAQQSLKAEQVELIDWSNLGASLGGWADSGLDGIRSFFSDLTIDASSGEEELGANILVREMLRDGALVIDFEDPASGQDVMGITISQLRVYGLDSMLEVDVLKVLAPQTLENKMRFGRLRLELDVRLQSNSTFEVATYSYQVNNVDVDLSLLLAVDWNSLGQMQVGSVLSLRKILPCMISKFHAIEVTQLLVNVESIDLPQIKGFLSEQARESLHKATREFLDFFTYDLLSSVPKICDLTVRGILNGLLTEFLSNEEVYCLYNTTISNDAIIDFRDLFLSEREARRLGGRGDSPYGDVFRMLFREIQEHIASVDAYNQSSLNDLIVRPFTMNQSNVNGSMLFPGEVFNSSGTARLSNWILDVEARVSDVHLENLDSIGSPLQLLLPVLGEASVLNNTISVGVGPEALRLAAKLYLSLSDSNELDMKNEINLTLDLDTVTLFMSLYLAMSEASLFALPLRSLQDVNCWLSTIPPESLDSSGEKESKFRYSLSAVRADLNISCASCGSPRFGELIQRLYNVGDTEEEVQHFVDEAESLIDSVLGSDFLQHIARNIVSEAAIACPSSPQYDPSASLGTFWVQPATYLGFEPSARDTKMLWFNIANAIVAIILLLGAIAARLLIRRRNRVWLLSLPQDQVDTLRRQDVFESSKDEYIDSSTDSMFRSDQIPLRIRYAVPFVILLNICLYLAAHIALLCYINVEAQVAGEHFTVERFLEFAFFQAAIRTYRNGGNEMALFLIFFSGIWPYFKLIGALIMWFIPPKRLNVARRGKLFLWMDALTKLSIIDLVVLLIAIAAIMVYLGGPGEEFYSSNELYAMTLVVVPSGGFYCIMIAQRLNRVSSRFFLDYHHKIVSVASEEYRRLNRFKRSDDRAIYESGTTLETAASSFSESRNDLSRESDNVAGNSESPIVRNVTQEETSEFLFDDIDDTIIDVEDDAPPVEIDSRESTSSIVRDAADFLNHCSKLKCRRSRMLAGTFGVVMAIVTVVILIIGCILAPAMSLDVKELLGIALESGKTYSDAVDEFNVFRVISLVLLEARFVLSSSADYVGLGILLVLGGLSIILSPAIQGWRKLRSWWRARRTQQEGYHRQRRKSVIPGFTNRLKLWDHMEVYVVSFCIASWQLGAVVAYVIHNYCFLLQRLYESLGYAGLIERTESNCFRVQASAPFTLLIFIGSFFLLLASFLVQMYGQYEKNREYLEELMEEDTKSDF